MGLTLAQKLIKAHLVEGEMIPGTEIGLRIDQTLTQDATGTMAYLEFEAMGVDRVKTEKSVAYIDHNTLQTGFENADDHRYIQTVTKKHGIYFSRPGNGICHQVHLERFGIPGKTLIGSDSHTPTGGGGKIIEYGGDGVKTLSVPERATITNMGAELGATTSIFPSDEITLSFLRAQGRESDWTEILPDPDAEYDEVIDIDLCKLEPLAACPHMPDNVKSTEEIGKIKVDQVAIGSCTNSSYTDMMKVASILKGKTICPTVSLCIAPGSKQVLNMLALNGALADMINAGARILESACGPCIGMGQSPNSKGVSLRTFNRNFEGRSGTKDASIYLVSPEVAACSALTGYLTDPREMGEAPKVSMPEKFIINDNMIEPPASEEEAKDVEVLRGPNIKPFPKTEPLPAEIEAKAVLKVGDNITTDHIMPAGAKILPYRSNIPHLSQFCFGVCDETFPERIKKEGKGFIIGGANYGQGSSREHAALVPLYLGVKAVITKSFARIHVANLVNAGILPFTFKNEADYDKIAQGDELALPEIRERLRSNESIVLKNITKGEEYELDSSHLSERQRDMLLCGGLLDYTREMNK